MAYSRTVYFQNRVFAAGELAKNFGEVLQSFGADPEGDSIRIAGELADGTRTVREFQPAKSLQDVCDLSQWDIRGWFDGRGGMRFYVSLDSDGTTIAAHLSADDAATLGDLADALRTSLRLEDAEPAEQITAAVKSGFEEALRPLEDRIKALEEGMSAPSRRLRCFFSYRFDPNTEVTALRIQQFLAALDVEVITGAQYEPRRISDKVLTKLRQPLDFIVLLVTARGESMWTRDEIGAGVHHNLPVVPIVESGARFETGLFADLEYIPFEAPHVGDAFLQLVQAVNFIRAGRRAETPGENGEA